MNLNESLLNAAIDGNLSGVKAALENGADVNAKDNEGATALMAASGRGRAEIVSLLKSAGAKE